jgi:tetratricopeptide (TPR) repeat protein
MQAGEKLLEKNDPKRAILQFRNAVQATPKNADVYYRLGVAYLAADDIRNGFISLRQAVELNPKHRDAQLRLSQLMAITIDPGVLKEAQRRLNTLLQDAPDDSDALHALALTELKLGDPEDSIRHFEHALRTAPQDLALATNLAQAKLQQNDPKGAEEVLRKACETAPRSADAMAILGRFYASQNRMAEAEEQYQRALTTDPKNPMALIDLATLQNQTGRKQEAEENFKRLSDLSDGTFKHAYANFLLQEGRPDEAVKEFERLAKQNPSDRLSRTRLVAVYQTLNRLADAQTVLNGALKKNAKDLDALLQRGEISLGAGKYGLAEADFNQVLRLQPDSAEVHYSLARLRLAQGATLRYRQELAEALRINPYLAQIRLELAQALIATSGKNGGTAALELLDSTPSAQKESIPVIVQRNWALWSLKNFAEMRKGIDRGLSRDKSTDLLLQDALWNMQAGDFSAAQIILEKALKADMTDVRALELLTQTYVAQKRSDLAWKKAEDYAERQPKSAPAQELLGMVRLASGDRVRARAAFTAAKVADPHYAKADQSLVQLDVLEGKWDDAGSKLKTMLAADEGNSTARLWLGDVEAKEGDLRAALENYRKVVDRDPGNSRALNNLAYVLVTYANQPDEALKLAQKAVELAPQDPDCADTLGWTLYQKGLYGPAIQHLERAASKDGNVAWKYHLAMAYAKAGEPTRARTVLRAALRVNPNAPEAELASKLVQSTN